MKKLFLLMTTVLLMTVCAVAQTKVVSGTVVYAGDNEPLPGATVLPVGGGHGTATDIDGKFTLTVPASVSKLRVSYVGMIEQTVTAGQDIIVKLDNSENNLDEVMVVAYGTSKKSAYTGSASVVKAEQIEQRQVTNAVSALAGTVAGTQVVTTNGQPGSSPKVYIRGVGSLNAGTDPLYVVDGMPFDGDIASLNTNDIESMTVLKDAASAALYGARGANGVILITTKSGREGDAVVTVDAKWGSNSRELGSYDVIQCPALYTEMAYQALRNGYIYHQGLDAATAHYKANQDMYNAFGQGYQIWTIPAGQQMIGTNGKLNPAATLGYSNGKNYFIPDDWAKETFRHGLRQEYNVSISGGSDRFKFYGSFGYLGDEGIIKGSSYDRISSRVSAEYQAKKWLSVGASIAYNHVKSGWPSGQDDGGTAENAFGFCDGVAPIYPMYVRNADGTLMLDPRNGNPVYDYGDGKYANGTSRLYLAGGNAASSFIYDSSDILMDILSSKWYATVTPIENLNISGSVGYFLDHTRSHEISNPWYGSAEALGGIASQASARTRAINLQALASYRHTLADIHHLDYLLGYESYDLNTESLSAYGMHLYNPYNWAVSNTLNDTNRQVSGGNPTNYTTRGIFGRINYDYDSRYFLSVSYRRDASSRFAPDKRWGNFYSLSAAWDMSKEKFMQPTASWLDLLKLKFSFGQQGNDDLMWNGASMYYPYLDQYGISGETSWADGNLYYKGNPDITWETSNALNAGVDFSFLQGKVAGTIEYFQRQTSDMLYNRPVAPSLGYESFPMNVGSMKNYGIELEINYRPISTRNVTWELNANITWIRNKIIKLNEDTHGQIKMGMTLWKEGESRYNYLLVDYAGVNPENGEALYWTHDPLKDANGQTITDAKGNIMYGPEYMTNNYDHAFANNRKETGNNLPPVYGGFGTTVKFFGFDFGMQFSYQIGGHTFDNLYGRLMHPGGTTQLGTNFHTDMLRAWTPENRFTDIPKLDTQALYDLGGQWTTFNMVSSNYLSLNNITLGYTLPAKWTNKLGIESVRIYGVADNVALWSKRKGLDPRMTVTATGDYGTYSVVRTISGGIKVVF